MNAIAAADVRAFILAQVVEPLRAKQLDPGSIPDDFDLLLEGVIDSFGIVELISAIEDHFRFELDLEAIDPDDVTRVDGLARYVEAMTETRDRAAPAGQ